MFNIDGSFNEGHMNNWQHAAMYFAFMISGCVDLAGFYTELPPDSEQASQCSLHLPRPPPPPPVSSSCTCSKALAKVPRTRLSPFDFPHKEGRINNLALQGWGNSGLWRAAFAENFRPDGVF